MLTREFTKVCTGCGVPKPLEDFYTHKNTRDGHRPDCKKCVIQRSRASHLKDPEHTRKRIKDWRSKNPGLKYRGPYASWTEAQKIRARAANKKYHRENPVKVRNRHLGQYRLADGRRMTVTSFNELAESQLGKCGVCSNPPRWGGLVVDHSHKTGLVRALVCRDCNTLLGLARDSAETLKKASEYLRLHEH